MSRRRLKLRELRQLPLVTLAKMALAFARQIDAGADDDRGMLETIMSAIAQRECTSCG